MAKITPAIHRCGKQRKSEELGIGNWELGDSARNLDLLLGIGLLLALTGFYMFLPAFYWLLLALTGFY